MHINDLGWTPFFQRQFGQIQHPQLVPARVVRQDRTRYLIHDATDVMPAVLPGTLRHSAQAERPVVGDWVAVERLPQENQVVIRALLERNTAFSRKQAGTNTQQQVVAANIDWLFIVSGLDGDFNLRRIERYVTQAWDSGAMPIILLNKTDLCDDVEGRILAVETVAMGVAVHAISAEQSMGLETLSPYVQPGQTVAFIGSSGVGKSTLVNALMGRLTAKTSAVREDDSRGRHTTTHRELHVLPSGGLLIDTPGMRELQLWTDETSLQSAFADIEDLAQQCRFRDCTHMTEPECAVRAALASGELDEGRYHSYRKQQKELAYLALRQNESATFEKRKKDKALTKMYKEHILNNPKRRW